MIPQDDSTPGDRALAASLVKIHELERQRSQLYLAGALLTICMLGFGLYALLSLTQPTLSAPDNATGNLSPLAGQYIYGVENAQPEQVKLGGHSLTIWPGGEIAWKASGRNIALTQNSGRVFYRVASQHSATTELPSIEKIVTPHATVSIRGTCLSVEVSEDLETKDNTSMKNSTAKLLGAGAIAGALTTVSLYEGAAALRAHDNPEIAELRIGESAHTNGRDVQRTPTITQQQAAQLNDGHGSAANAQERDGTVADHRPHQEPSSRGAGSVRKHSANENTPTDSAIEARGAARDAALSSIEGMTAEKARFWVKGFKEFDELASYSKQLRSQGVLAEPMEPYASTDFESALKMRMPEVVGDSYRYLGKFCDPQNQGCFHYGIFDIEGWPQDQTPAERVQDIFRAMRSFDEFPQSLYWNTSSLPGQEQTRLLIFNSEFEVEEGKQLKAAAGMAFGMLETHIWPLFGVSRAEIRRVAGE